ncbi:putative 3-hydroxyacyl-CoA dehydrogenase [Thamnocephalis sphaerospora]|uniref:Putative 3-hydroxyacyl-CoA dehydrogenase n=1 Tax=Thamnocephalis sphaerospora TaxID=78915 RepID=A0A4P9XHT2_9FUNG|nr:putative 3-hydroxyacyl-CoA dehydrogenase [Thamnocephalis sphaerospora]|eukprot:RKP05228.1 putative 3-hydroxyacyl-CoA dehydrogenase [Thamnocephalis sphaerospora]
MRIEGNTFFVTGGASGLGRASCKAIVERGGNVAIIDMNETMGNELAAELGDRALWPGSVNVTSEEAVLGALQQTKAKFGDIHVVLNIAGITDSRMLLDAEGNPQSQASFDRVIDINLKGPFNVLRLAAAEMIKQPAQEENERGVIVNVASVAKDDGAPSTLAYAASKAGIASMSLPLARELGMYGIRVFAISPGCFATPMSANASQIDYSPLFVYPNRMGRPEEFAKVVLDSIENRMINGTTIAVHGAVHTQPVSAHHGVFGAFVLGSDSARQS